MVRDISRLITVIQRAAKAGFWVTAGAVVGAVIIRRGR